MAKKVHLSKASKAEHYHKELELNCLVAGKESSPYLLPKIYAFECQGALEKPDCFKCFMAQETDDGPRFEKSFDLLPGNKTLLSLIGKTQNQLVRILRRAVGIPRGCQAMFRIDEAQNVEVVKIIPEIDYTGDWKYVTRKAYFMGPDIECNQTYKAKAITVNDPNTQEAVHVILKAEASASAVAGFKLQGKDVVSLRSRFSIKGSSYLSAKKKLEEIYYELSKVTRIWERPDLHQIVDLTYHSPLHFNFNGELVHKGWLETLIVGDTRTGKGFVAEGLARFYRLGEVITAENVTFVGLVGGLNQIDKRFVLTWGRIPLNHGRLVIIDEGKELDEQTLGRMTRIRSEGVAELDKADIHAKTMACTRLIWLSNPKGKRMMERYSHGVHAVRELIGNPEDISRFDLVLTVARGEVPSEIINSPHNEKQPSESARDLYHRLVMWTWSRKTDDIVFKGSTTNDILGTYSPDLSRRFSPSIPLIQAETVRLKLARIATAIAARLFSTDALGKNIIVHPIHARLAYEIILHAYTKQSMGYDLYTRAEQKDSYIENPQDLESLVMALDSPLLFVETMLETNKITIKDVANYAGIDRELAKDLVNQMIKCRAISKYNTFYTKRHPFTVWLNRMRNTLMRKKLK